FFSSRRRHTRSKRDWSSDVCSSDLNYLSAMGRHEEAMAEVFVAQELDPLSAIINLMVGYMGFLKRDYALAVKYCRQTLEIDPNRSEERRVGKEWRSRWAGQHT